MEKELLSDALADNKNKFIIQIISRENNTWQGTVEWIEKRKRMPFRSALELICLLESALDEQMAG
ncbi:MAG: hypothetical protein HUJ75_07940 [Parasporobacterium sp.]|nr:hypothetical protein [Parasporobacterium sp.]